MLILYWCGLCELKMFLKSNVIEIVGFQYLLITIVISNLVNSNTSSLSNNLVCNNTSNRNTTLETIAAFINTTGTLTLDNTTDEFKSEDQSCLVEDEIYLQVPDLVRKKGYPFESHQAITADGYILEIHRIVNHGKPAIVAFHGMTLSSRDFLINCGRKAFGYKMFDSGFDVWLANVRGTLYSQKHLYLNIHDPEYWDFTLETVIQYDVPSIIDYILKVTRKQKLHWVGYSLGTSLAMGLGSFRPEYYKKLGLIFLMGATAYVGNATSPLLRSLAPFSRIQEITMTYLSAGDMLPPELFPVLRRILPLICLPEAKIEILGMCVHFLFLVDGRLSNPSVLPMILGSIPGPVGVKMLSQWFQWVNSGKFSYYNFGPRGNLGKYGNLTPPNYDLRKATGRFVNMWAQKDLLSVPKDVERVVRELPNLVLNIKIKNDAWNHLDFAYGKDADIYVYDEIIAAINKFG